MDILKSITAHPAREKMGKMVISSQGEGPWDGNENHLGWSRALRLMSGEQRNWVFYTHATSLKVYQRSMEGFFAKAKTYLNSYYLAVIISESGDVSNQRVNMENTAPIAFPARLD